jgi:hypothetical protein
MGSLATLHVHWVASRVGIVIAHWQFWEKQGDPVWGTSVVSLQQEPAAADCISRWPCAMLLPPI